MVTTTRSEFFDENGKKVYTEEQTTEFKTPVFLNIQICIEKEQFEKIKSDCTKYKTTIVKAIQDLLEYDPDKLTEQYF